MILPVRPSCRQLGNRQSRWNKISEASHQVDDRKPLAQDIDHSEE